MHLRSICCGKNALLLAFLFVMMHTASALPMNNQHWTDAGSSSLSSTETLVPGSPRLPVSNQVVVIMFPKWPVNPPSPSRTETQGVQSSIISELYKKLGSSLEERAILFQSIDILPDWDRDSTMPFNYYFVLPLKDPRIFPSIPKDWPKAGSGKVEKGTPPGQLKTTIEPERVKPPAVPVGWLPIGQAVGPHVGQPGDWVLANGTIAGEDEFPVVSSSNSVDQGNQGSVAIF
ncbi:hypothetical protein EV360DRAFT_73579 [Lentinula raphanica]|nr:hypothetical protein EV360DRAFT_73579 [Lentinula raphanica]